MAGVQTVPAAPRSVPRPNWGERRFESADTTRLNHAHWARADDLSVNVWLASQLATIRSRSIYEARQNGMVSGVINTYADDVVGQDGPVLQVQSENDAYNRALEKVWRDWFRAPTFRRNVSGAALLKLWVRNLWKCGEYMAQIATDATADGPVAMRLKPVHPRRLGTPVQRAGDPMSVMGIRFDLQGRPATYYVGEAAISGQAYVSALDYAPVPADLMIHEFLMEEEDQARGIPWLNAALQPMADLRDYDDQVQDAARQIADQCSLLYTEHPDAELWQNPENVDIQRRRIRMLPPGWKPFTYTATQPPVQYPEYRAERLRELGRPVGMPLLIVRLDASKHNYSSARLDTQCYRRAVGGVQRWISGSERNTGVLSSLVDVIATEARFSVPDLRARPESVIYAWTWPAMPHVDPQKEAQAEEISLANATETLTDVLASRGKDIETHIATLVRERALLEEAGISPPAWLAGPAPPPDPAAAAAEDALAAIDEEEVLNA
jgi:lambda family phage portal protein